jgi:hypothetical protein
MSSERYKSNAQFVSFKPSDSNFRYIIQLDPDTQEVVNLRQHFKPWQWIFFAVMGVWDRRFWRGGRTDTEYLFNLVRALSHASIAHYFYNLFKIAVACTLYMKIEEVMDQSYPISNMDLYQIILPLIALIIWMHWWAGQSVKSDEATDANRREWFGIENALRESRS